MSKPKVLLIDDDNDIRIAFTYALSDDFEIITSKEGAEALELLKTYAADVILLDLRMPGMDGWQFLEHYQGPIPVVVMSAWWENRPLPREPFALFSKPADMREVAVILRQAARSWGRLAG